MVGPQKEKKVKCSMERGGNQPSSVAKWNNPAPWLFPTKILWPDDLGPEAAGSSSGAPAQFLLLLLHEYPAA